MTPEQFNSFTEVEFFAIMGAMLIIGAMFGWLLTLINVRERKLAKREAAIKERKEYLEWLRMERNNFVDIVWDVDHVALSKFGDRELSIRFRVQCENLLIAYDQLRQYYKDHE